MNTAKIAGMAKRGYSREFTPRVRTPESRRSLHVDWVPPTLFDRIALQAKQQGISLRAHVLRLLSATVAHGHPVRQRQIKTAHKATQQAIRRGELVRPERCPECGKVPIGRAVNSHHPDHDDLTFVEWACDACHGVLSRKLLTWGEIPQPVRIALKNKFGNDDAAIKALVLGWLKDWVEKDA